MCCLAPYHVLLLPPYLRYNMAPFSSFFNIIGDLGFSLPYKRIVSPSLSFPIYFSYLAYLFFPNREACHLSLGTTYTLVPPKSSYLTFAFILFFFFSQTVGSSPVPTTLTPVLFAGASSTNDTSS
jgi:hypothetical protein